MVSVRVLVTAVLPSKKNHSFSIGSKMFFFAPILLFLAMFWGPTSARANEIYIAQNATGAANGADCADALPYTYFNTAANWTAGAPTGTKIGPGTTVHLCGLFTGAAGSTLITAQGSGSSGNPVTLKFEPGATLTAPYWGSTSAGAITVSGRSWLVIDGGTNGIIQATDNGTGLTYHVLSLGIYVSNSSNVTIQNLTIANMCQHDPSDSAACVTGGTNDGGISIKNGATNVTVAKNAIHDTYTAVFYNGAPGDSNVTISYNTISRINWGIGGIGTTNGVIVNGNDISCVVGANCNWDPNSVGHHNGIMFFPQGTIMDGVVISNNFIHDINGQTTGYIFLDPNSTGDVRNALIYNNVFYTSPGQTGPANDMIEPGAYVMGTGIYNNTMVGPAACGFGYYQGATAENNIAAGQSYLECVNHANGGNTSAYNDFYGWTGSGGWTNNSAGIWSTIAAWQTASTSYGYCTGACDGTGSIVANPNLNASFVPNANSPVIGAGTNLISLGIPGLNTGAPQFFGVNYACGNGCVRRPSTGAWDMGAYQMSQGSVSLPNPPTNLTGTVH
jgi:hypothetical protein